MVVNCLKDVSTLLVIIPAVQTGNITQHLKAKKQILNLILALDHIKYARYNSFQQEFGVLHEANLHEAFSYPITSLPICIASPDSSLYQSDKAGFRNYIISPQLYSPRIQNSSLLGW